MNTGSGHHERTTSSSPQGADTHAGELGGEKNPTTWASHPIDIRLSLPFLHRRFYVTLVAGQERRRAERRRADRTDYPLLTAGNIFFSLGILTLLTIFALGALIAQSAIIE